MTPSGFFALPSQERLAMVALEQIDGSTCQCGHPTSEASHAEALGAYRAVTVVCHACKAVADAQSKAPVGGRVYAEKVWDWVNGEALVDDL